MLEAIFLSRPTYYYLIFRDAPNAAKQLETSFEFRFVLIVTDGLSVNKLAVRSMEINSLYSCWARVCSN